MLDVLVFDLLLAQGVDEIKRGTPPHVSGWKAFFARLTSWGPGGLFILAALDSAGVPIVGGVDALLVSVAATRPAIAAWAACSAVAGSLLGSAFLFWIARKGGELMLARYTATRQGARLHRWFERYGLVTVFIPALSPLPMPMKIPVFCAGALEVAWSHFLLTVGIARFLRYTTLAVFGALYGAQTLLFLRAHILSVSLAALLIAATAIIVLQLRQRRSRIAPEPERQEVT